MTLRIEVEAFIERRLRDPDLDVRQIAAAHYVSPRTLYRLFDSPGQSVARYIRCRRLDRCRREILTRPDLSLVAICERWGMGDPKHFARKYRARFGESPQETRLQAGVAPPKDEAVHGWMGTAAGGGWGGVVPLRQPGLTGWHSEDDQLERWLGTVRGGQGDCLVVRGDPGMGKSAVLGRLISAAAGFCVVRATAVQGETELPFAVLQQVCAPMLDLLGCLPGPQRDALAVAFGLRSGAAPEQFLLGLAVLSLLSAAAGKRPLLCVVDDAQWLDLASAQILAFVARRLPAAPVGMVFGTRDHADRFSGLPELGLRPLRPADPADLLESVLRAPVDEHVFRRFLAECQGKPLALPRMLTPEDLAGGFRTPDLTPAPGQIEDSFQRRAGALPAGTRQLLLVAAAARQFESADPGRARGIYLQALVAALRAGLPSADRKVTEASEAMHTAPPSDRPGRDRRPVDSGRQASPARPSRSAPASPPASSAPSTALAPATPASTAWPGSSSDSPPSRSSSPSPAVSFAPSATANSAP